MTSGGVCFRSMAGAATPPAGHDVPRFPPDEREPASAEEAGAHGGTIASHRFLGGHTWMAGMRGDAAHLARLRTKLVGVASIDVAGARLEAPAGATWHLPADGAPIVPGTRISLDVVIRNLLAGHRFPGGVLDIQDTWVEVEVTDRAGVRLAASGLTHADDPAAGAPPPAAPAARRQSSMTPNKCRFAL
jgi:hypothetical protein